jgi:Helix-turn-helix domain
VTYTPRWSSRTAPRPATFGHAWFNVAPHAGSLRAILGLTQAEMAEALGVTVNTWARWERGELAIHTAYRLLLDLIETRAERDADRTAARLRAPGGVRNLW